MQKVRDSFACRLCPWPIVPSPVTDAYVLAVGNPRLDFAEFTVGSHVRRFVRHQALLAQFPSELLEGLIQSLHISGDEGASAGRLTKLLQGLPVNPIYVRVADPYGTRPRQALDIVSPLI